jgi:hypothetical protein
MNAGVRRGGGETQGVHGAASAALLFVLGTGRRLPAALLAAVPGAGRRPAAALFCKPAKPWFVDSAARAARPSAGFRVRLRWHEGAFRVAVRPCDDASRAEVYACRDLVGRSPAGVCKTGRGAGTASTVRSAAPQGQGRGFLRPQSSLPELAPLPVPLPDLFEPHEVLTMEKPSPALSCPVMKSVPLPPLPLKPEQIRRNRRKCMILRSYTLCEVLQKSRQDLLRQNEGTRATC